MKTRIRQLVRGAVLVGLATVTLGASPQAPAGTAGARWYTAARRRQDSRERTTCQPGHQGPVPQFRARVDLITTDVIVRDGMGQFVADLKKGEFEVFEDGVNRR
jgi:hypothetical protein